MGISVATGSSETTSGHSGHLKVLGYNGNFREENVFNGLTDHLHRPRCLPTSTGRLSQPPPIPRLLSETLDSELIPV